MHYQIFEDAPTVKEEGFAPNRKSREALRLLIRELCAVTPLDSMSHLACRFYGEMDWDLVMAQVYPLLPGDKAPQINLAFPIDKEDNGLMQVYELQDDQGAEIWGVGLSTSTKERMIFHRMLSVESISAVSAFHRTVMASQAKPIA